MLDMNTEVDNRPLVGTVSASAVILDSQPAELQGNECCCWSCQPVVIHYGRGGSQSSKEISQHDGFPRGLLPALGCSCLQGGSLAASLQHTGLFFWWRWRSCNTDLTKSALGKWMNMNQIFPALWMKFTSNSYFYSSSRDVQWQWQTAGVTSVATT